MKKRCLRLLSCIFIIAMFFGGLCFYNVQTALTEISYETEADFHDFQLITTPKSSINDNRPENVLPRMGTRLLIRSIAAVILHNNFNIDNFYHIYSFNYSLDINPSYSTIIVDYIHKKDGSK